MKDQAGRGCLLDLTWPAPLINKSLVTVLQPDVTWITSNSGLKSTVGDFFCYCSHKTLEVHGPLTWACRSLISKTQCPSRSWHLPGLGQFLGFSEGQLGSDRGLVAWQGSLHRQCGFDSTPKVQGQIWQHSPLLTAQSMKSLFLCKDLFLPQ